MAIGVGQVGITLPDGAPLSNNAQLHMAPREIDFEFAPDVVVDPDSLGGIQLVRSGGDGTFGDGNDVAVAAGFLGIGDRANKVVFRFGNTPIDDFYRLNIVTAGAGALRDATGAALVVTPAQVNFQVDAGAQVVAVVPQPISRGAGGLEQARDTIEVYFNADNLQPNDLGVKNKDFYQLIYTAGTLSTADDVVYKPTLVNYDADADKAVLTFGAPLDELGSGAGFFRLRIGNDDQPLPAPVLLPQAQDAGDTFGTSKDLGALGASAQIVSAEISPNRLGGTPYNLPFPGGNDEPGHRDIPLQTHIFGADTSEGVDTVTFNFPRIYGTDRFGLPLFNLITEAQKQRTREIFSIYANYLGIQVAEVASDANGAASMGIVTGDVRALGVPQVGPAGVAGGSLAIMNAAVNWGESEYGGGWFTTAMHEVGHNLGLGHSYELPGAIQGGGPLAEDPLFPGTYDLVHGLHVHRPDSIDVDLYKFEVPVSAGQGRLTAEIKAERQDNASLLDSVLTLYAVNSQSGKFEIVSRNDDYFGADSFIAMDLAPGTYYLGVSSTGNTNYDPNMSASGLGGRTQGKYDLRLEFDPAHANSLKDTSGTEFDGDADGTPGGTFNFWFQANTPANTLVVDKIPGAGAGPLGSLTNPFTSLDDALATALPGQIVRVVGNGGVDGDLATLQDNFAYQIGLDDQGFILPDGENVEVPRGVNLMIDAGAVLKLQRAPISVGSFVQGYDLSGGALQILGTPSRSVYLTSLHDESVGLGAEQPTGRLPNLGDWAGIALHTDIDRLVNNDLDVNPNPNEPRRTDYEREGIFLNVINSAVISYAGGQAIRRGIEEKFAPIELHESRPTITYNRIVDNADAGITADPDSFEESRFWGNAFSADYDRVGPAVRGNTLTGNTINAMFIDVTTGTVPGTTEKVTRSTRWDDTDIVHVVQENLFIYGGEGGPLVVGGRSVARPNGRLAIDPNIIVKLGGARIETEIGGQLIAEGSLGEAVVFTSIVDDRFGAGGTFDTNADDADLALEDVPAPGDWGGLYLGPASKASLDHAMILFAGGATTIEGNTDLFNAVEIHQAEVRIANSLIQDSASGFAAGGRNGRGDNDPATLWAIGSQPILVGNTLRDNEAGAFSFDVNSLSSRRLSDYGRTTGPLDALVDQADNQGPLLRNNRFGNNGINAMVVRGGTVVVQSVWDDTDMVHVVQNEIVVPNFHSNTGLRLQSTPSENLVVKLSGENAGLTAGGNGLDISDRIGGTLQIIGTPAYPVVLTSLADDSVGAGVDLDGNLLKDTNNDGDGSTAGAVVQASGSGNVGSLATLPTPTGPPLEVAITPFGSDMVDALLLKPLPSGVTILNSTYFGDFGSAGVYSNGASVPLLIPGTGVLLTTGDADLPTTNLFEGFTGFMNAPGDSDLDDLIAGTGFSTVEASSLTITFSVTNPAIRSGSFRFQFGTEEFREYVNSPFNDVVGAFINGGAETNFLRDSQKQLITVNSAFFDIDNENPPYNLNLEYDGMTIGLVATFPVIQGTNTLKIAIGDTSDSFLDSGIFLSQLEFGTSGAGGGGGVTPDGEGTPGDWRSVLLGPNANDRNVGTYNELEDGDFRGADTNSVQNKAQYLGELAAHEKAGDDTRRLGLEVYGSIRAHAPNDVDLFSFRGVAGSEVLIDIDNSSQKLDSVLELLNASGQRVAISQDSVQELLGQDLYSVNPRDAGMRVTLPGVAGTVTTYFVRVQSNGPAVTPGFSGEQTTGQYRLNVRLRAQDEISGSTVRHADIRYATNGIEVRGLPRHSPLLVESGDRFVLDTATGTPVSVANNSPLTAVDLGNLLGSDRSAIGVAGALLDPTAVNWYKFSAKYQDIQEIAGVNGGRKNWSTIFDIDWADGVGRPDTLISVFQQIDGTLDAPILTPVLLGRDSDISDDQANGQTSQLSRGSFGTLDPFIGPAILPAGGTLSSTFDNDDDNQDEDALTYYVAVHSNAVLPFALSASFTRRYTTGIARQNNDPRKLFRLEPVSSARRVVEDHIGATGFGTGDGGAATVEPSTGPILNIDSAEALRAHVQNFNLSDVTLFVSQGGGLQQLVTIDPQTGVQETTVGGIGEAGRPIGDIAIRSDGAMFAYNAANTVAVFETNAGELSQVDPATAQRVFIGLDGIFDDADNELTDGIDDLETITNFEVGALTFRRFDINANLGINDHYWAYYAVDNNGPFNNGTSRLFLANPTNGSATITPNFPWGPVGDILEFVQGDLVATIGDENDANPNLLENAGDGAQVVTITRPAHTAQFELPVNVSLITIFGGAPRAVLADATVTFPVGELTTTVSINTIDNAVADGTQNLLVMATGFDPIYGVPFNSVSDRLNILDDEPNALPRDTVVTLTVNGSSTMTEGGPNQTAVLFAATAAQPNSPTALATPLTVRVQTGDRSEVRLLNPSTGLPVDQLDVTIPAGAAGVANATVTLIPIVDNVLDGAQTPNLLVSAVGHTATRTPVTINDIDTDLNLTVAIDGGARTIAENDGFAATQATVTRPASLAGTTMSVNLVAMPLNPGTTEAIWSQPTLTFLPGDTSLTVSIDAVDDLLADGTKAVIFSATGTDPISGRPLNPKSDLLTVSDDEAPPPDDRVVVMTLAGGAPGVTEGGIALTNNRVFIAAANALATPLALNQPVTVKLRTSDSSEFRFQDPLTLAAVDELTVTVPAGNPNQARALVTILPVSDFQADGNQTVQALVSAVDLGSTRTSVVVTDVDVSLDFTITIDSTASTVTENAGIGATRAIVTRPAALANQAMTITLTATPVVSGTTEAVWSIPSVNFLPGQTQATININAIDDLLVDGTRSVVFSASGINPLTGQPLNVRSDVLTVFDDETIFPNSDLEVKIELSAGSIAETGAPLTNRPVYIAPVGQGFANRINLAQPVNVTLISADDSEVVFIDGGGNRVSTINVTIPAGAQPFVNVTIAPVDDGEKDGTRTGNIIVASDGYRSTRTGLAVVGPEQDIGFTRGMAFAQADGLRLSAPNGNVIRDDHFFTLSDFSRTQRFEFLSDARISTPDAAGITDGTAFEIEITRGLTAQTLRFEFNLTGGVAGGNIAIDLLPGDGAGAVAAKIAAAINAQGISNLSAATGGGLVTLSGDFDWVELGGTPLSLTNVQSGNRPVYFELTDFSNEVSRKLAKAISEAAEDDALDVSVVPGANSFFITVIGAAGFSPLNSFVQSFSLPNGGLNLWGVSDAGAIYAIDANSGLASVVHVEPGVRFAGLALGPQNLDFDGDGAGGDLATTLFAITENGNLYAFDVSGIDPENPPPLNDPNFFRTDLWGSQFIATNLPSVTGLAFSPLDFNLWHPTTVAGIDPTIDAGHGVNPTFDLSRPLDATVDVGAQGVTQALLAAQGALSFRFSLSNTIFGASPEGAIPYPQATESLGTVNEGSQYGILRRNNYLDLIAFNAGLTLQRPAGFVPDIGDNYNLPGGAYGSLITDPFSLFGYNATDKPTLYFNYFLEGEGSDPIAHPEGQAVGLGSGAMRDSARVFASVDDGQTWQLLATNNVQLDAELPKYISASSDRPEGDLKQRIQPLYEMEHLITYPALGSIDHFWRQARIDLGEFAGERNVKLRFDFSTAGTVPGDGFTSTGDLGSAERSANNDFRGFAIDDIIVGFAERGEMITAPLAIHPETLTPLTPHLLPNPVVSNSIDFVPVPRPDFVDPDEDILTGPYQLEIRRGSLYAEPGPESGSSNPISAPPIFRQIDTNDPQVEGFTLRLPALGSIREGDRFRVDDGRLTVTFQFTLSGAVAPGNEAILFQASGDVNALAQTVAQEINARYPNTVKAVARAVGGIVDITGPRSVELLAATFADPPPSSAQTALQDYLNNGDPFTPPTVPANEVTTATYRALNLRMNSQTWRTDVSPSLWQNWVTLIIPNTVTSETALLLVTGSNLSDSPPSLNSGDFDIISKYAVDTKSVAVILYNVPNQPTDIFADTRGDHSLEEDELIASSMDQFLRTGDPTWPALLPMVKSAVRAMDTTQNYVNNVLNLSQHVNDFVVTGFSKRGWTTYLTGANDDRVKAIMPGVFDALNLYEQLDQHGQTYANILDFTRPDPVRSDRRYSAAIEDYVNYRIVNAPTSSDPVIRANSPKLLQILDPYQYRDKLDMPKYLVNAAGDEFFVNDSSQYYVHDLIGPTYLRMVPNAGHGLGEGNFVNIPTARGKTVMQDVVDGFQAFYEAIVNDEVLPQFSWTRNSDGSLDLSFDPSRRPTRVVGWTADAENGDYRWGGGFGPEWRQFTGDSGHPDGSNELATHWELDAPSKGSRAFLVELEFDRGPGKLPFVFTTEVSVVRATPLRLAVEQNRGVGDDNRFREQGQVLLESNRVTFAAEYGIRIEADTVIDPDTLVRGRQEDPNLRFINASTGLPAMGVAANLREINNTQTVTGVSVSNNVVAFNGDGAIRFVGDANTGVENADGTVTLDGPVSASMFGRIYNNTLFGAADPSGNGIEVGGAAAPTIMNNVLANFVAAVPVGPSVPGLGTSNAVLTANVYQGNGANAVFVNAAGQVAGQVTENFRVALAAGDPLFVDGAGGNFTLASGSRSIDASINALQDRLAMTTVTSPLGIPQSPILAPDRDLFGQLRSDDPAVSPFPGLGANVFKDRGAVERLSAAQTGVLQINDVSQKEGNDGASLFVFTITLSAPSSQLTTVTVTTTGDTAESFGDFADVQQVVTFRPGETVKTVTVEVVADSDVEADERFFVDLSSPSNASITRSRGTGTIVNDDVEMLSLKVENVTQLEGTSGLTPFVFTVSLGTPIAEPVTVQYGTQDGTAKAGQDYQPTSGQFTIAPGSESQLVTVNVLGATTNEANKNFILSLSSTLGSQTAAAKGVGTILNDDVAGSQTVATGPEVLVNSARAGNQDQADVAMDAQGNYVVVWTTWDALGNGDIRGQRYRADGTPLGNEFLVNAYTSGNQQSPKIAMEDDGNFVVVWSGKGVGRDGQTDESGVFGQAFGPTGAPRGQAFRVNDTTGSFDVSPDVAVHEDGTFVVAWHTKPAADSTAAPQILAQKMSAAGDRVGGLMVVSQGALQLEAAPAIALDSVGNAFLAWGGVDGGRMQVIGRTLSAAGALGTQLLVSDAQSNQPQVTPAVAAFGTGQFVVGWSSESSPTSASNVYRRNFQFSSPTTPVTLVNAPSPGDRSSVDVAVDNQGRVAMSWVSKNQDGSGLGVYGRLYDAAGADVSQGELLVNTTVLGNQFAPALALNPNGGGQLVAVWTGESQETKLDVYSQRYSVVFDASAPAPPIVYALATQATNEGQTLSVAVGADDPNGDNLSYHLAPGAPAGVSIHATTGQLVWNQPLYSGQSAPISVIVRDNSAQQLSSTTTVMVNVQNVAPTVSVSGPTSAALNQPLTLTLNGSDPSLNDPNALLTYQVDWNGDGQVDQTVQGRGQTQVQQTFTAAGDYDIHVTVLDQAQASGSAQLTLNVTESLPDVTPVELGTIITTRIDDAAVSGDGLLYHFTTSRSGQLTLEALFDPALGTPTLRLFNQAGTELAQASSGNGIRRIDIVTAVGASYFLAVEGNHPSVDLRFTNALAQSGTGVTLTGGNGDDNFTFTRGLFLETTINGTIYSFPDASVTSITIDGGPGDDSLTLTGGAGNERVDINPGSALWTGAGSAYTVNGVNMRSILAIGGGGVDQARLFDSAGNDNLNAQETQVTLTGAGYVSTVQGFANVRAQASLGLDRADLFDSAGDDQLIARADRTTLGGAGYFNEARGFDVLRAFASAGNDQATFYDSTGDDQFTARPDRASLGGVGFFNEGRGFDTIRAFASAGNDTATLNDSAGNDQLTIRTKEKTAVMTGNGFSFDARDFDSVRAFASTGRDTAALYDSDGSDRLLARPDFTQLSHSSFLGQANGFDEVRAYATLGIDTADLYGSGGADQLLSRAEFSQLVGATFLNYAQGFDQVRSYGSGGNDLASLYGAGNDTFDGRSGSSRLTGAQGSRQAFDFDTVRAYAGGGTTNATLNDTALNDHLLAQGNLATISGVDYALSVYDFQRVVARASTGTNTRTINAHDFLLEQEGNWLDA